MRSVFKKYNEQGLIPGPDETEEDFLKRCDYCLSKVKQMVTTLYPKNAQDYQEVLKDQWLLQASKLNHAYDISPCWVPLFFSNWKMMPWQGASTWIFQLEENTPTSAVIQLRKKLYQKDSLLGLYAKEELIAHELCHVARMKFEEPKFEEMLAYRFSKRQFSRYFGPLMQSISESRWLMIFIVMIVLLDFAYFFQGAYHLMLNPWIYSLPLIILFFAAIRLYLRHKTLERAATLVGEALLFRLTDREIEEIAKLKPGEVTNYIEKQNSFRWHFIRLCYSKEQADF